MRVYYRPQGSRVGVSTGIFGVGALFWLWLLFLPLLAVLYYFPRAVWSSGLTDAAKLVTVGTVWGTLLVIGIVASADTASSAKAAGCVDLATVPASYLLPASDQCPAGYVPKLGCTVTVTADPAQGTGGCAFGEKPAAVTGP